MNRKLLTSMLALWTLAFTGPASAFVCQLPCTMTQKQMMDCARSCSAKKPPLSVGKGDCSRLEIRAMPVFTALDALAHQAPAVAVVVESNALAASPTSNILAAYPLRGPPADSPSEHPSAHAPPTLI